MVFVLNESKQSLMPCTNVIARLLLKQGKAKVRKRVPFTIQLNYTTNTEYLQPLTHGLDVGSSKIGSAVVNQKNEVIYMSEIEIRNDITKKMKQRAKYRRNRRNRKTRYRKARWLNRKNSNKLDRFSPTITSKINSHLKEIKFVNSILPISKLILETAIFDAHLLKNPEVKNNKLLYQQGINYGFANTKSYVLNRDNYQCQNCKAKKVGLEVHHIIYRSNYGSDEENNLITLCKSCHNSVHDESLVLNLKGKKKGTLKHATQMNSIRKQLLRYLPDAIESFGYITKEHRQLIGLEKEHYNDAIAIACEGNKVTFKTKQLIQKKCVSDGDFQLSKGVRSEQKIPKGKLFGFRKFDKVLYKKNIYFIKGRRTRGYFELMDIYGNNIKFTPNVKVQNLKRLSARKSWLINEIKI